MILVTGGTGFIGRAVLDLLSQGRTTVLLASRNAGDLRLGDAESLRPRSLDLLDRSQCSAAMVDVRDVIHLAGRPLGISVSRPDHEEVAMRNLVEASRASGKVRRFVYLSASGASERSPLDWLRCKARAEKILVDSGIGHVILRAGLVYDVGDRFVNALGSVVRRESLITAPFFCRGSLRPISLGDLVIAVVTALDHHRMNQSVIDVGEPEALSLFQLLDLIACRLRKKVKVRRSMLRPTLSRKLASLENSPIDDPGAVLRWFALAEPPAIDRYDDALPMRRSRFVEKLREYPWGMPPPRPGDPLPVIQPANTGLPAFIVAPHLREPTEDQSPVDRARWGRVDPFSRPLKEGSATEEEKGEGPG